LEQQLPAETSNDNPKVLLSGVSAIAVEVSKTDRAGDESVFGQRFDYRGPKELVICKTKWCIHNCGFSTSHCTKLTRLGIAYLDHEATMVFREWRTIVRTFHLQISILQYSLHTAFVAYIGRLPD